MARIAFIGLGRMGSGMAQRLLAAGHELVVANRTASAAKPLLAAGARFADSPRQAVEGVEAAFVMVSDDDASRAVWLGPDGVLAGSPTESAFAIESSTLSAGWVAELSAVTRSRGWRYLDCPVTGLPDAAAAGELTLLIGAADDDLRQARALLKPLASQLVRFGDVGAGTAYKLIVNLIGAVQIAGIAEGLALAERAGLDLRQVEAALATGQAASPQVVRNARRMVAGDHADPVTFSGRLRRKDAAYAMRLAQQLGAAAPFGATALAALDELLDAGLGEVNESAVIEIARRRAHAAP